MNAHGLQKVFDQNVGELAKELEKYPWNNPDFYASWLAQTYYLVKHTTRFLGLAAGKMSMRHDLFHKQALDHIREERGHETFALNDLTTLGYNIQDLPELPQTQALYHAQYYFIEHHGPISHYGYSLLLEGLAAIRGQWLSDVVKEHYGKKTNTFLRVHAAEDVKHFSETLEMLSHVTEEEKASIVLNLEQSTPRYLMMLDGVAAAVQKNTRGLHRAA